MKSVLVAPSLLSADFSKLGSEIKDVENAGADLLHLDVMDGHFVPNITFGPPLVRSVRKATTLPLDVHLMVEEPDRFLEPFAKAGANWLSVQVEACVHLDRVLRKIRELGCSPGVALNPSTPVCLVEPVLELLDFVLIMSVNPGFGGQEFIPYSLDKLRELRRILAARGLDRRIEIDGGVGPENVAAIVDAGATVLVAGNSVFGRPDRKAAIEAIRSASIS